MDLHEFYTRLCGFYRQFSGLANNYNQTVRAIHNTFGAEKAHILLKELREQTADMSKTMEKIIEQCEGFREIWSAQNKEE